MRSLILGAALGSLAGECVSASTTFFPRARTGNGFISIPVDTVSRPRKVKRQEGEPIVTELDNMDFFYATTVGIGNPVQEVTVLVDTGSSELWVNPDCSLAPSTSQARECFSFGQYDPDESNTPPVGPFGSETIRYGDPTEPATLSQVEIRYYADDLEMGSATITNQTFGVVVTSDGQSSGIMGLAPDLYAGFDGETSYSLLLNTMAEQGVIARRTFALDLRHSEAETGAIIYGGVDRSKFIGQLESQPIIRGQQGEFRLAVSLDTIGYTTDTNQQTSNELSGNSSNVMLDSGTSLTRMHDEAGVPILRALGAQDDGTGYYVVPCTMRDSPGSIDFGFGSKIIRVPLSDFILDVGDPTWCYAGLTLTTDQQILGDTVLRAGYFVFDWDSETIHIAQAANCGDEDIVAFDSGDDAESNVEGNCDESDANFQQSTSASHSSITQTAPTGAYTTTFTVTSCPVIETDCVTGVVTTQTFHGVTSAPMETVTVTVGGDGGGGGDGDSAGMRIEAFGGLLAGFGAMAVLPNVL